MLKTTSCHHRKGEAVQRKGCRTGTAKAHWRAAVCSEFYDCFTVLVAVRVNTSLLSRVMPALGGLAATAKIPVAKSAVKASQKLQLFLSKMLMTMM